MMKRITLQKEQIYHGPLILVNARHALREDVPKRLVPVDNRHARVFMEYEAAVHLEQALEAICCEGKIATVSAYRPLEEQKELYRKSLLDNGEEFTRKYVALPGHSEHQTGFAIDLGLWQKNIDFIRPAFPYDGICGEFRTIAARYGFVERYAQGRESVTGIAHEPWHFRYVGVPHAELMETRQLSLEEYTAFIKAFEWGGKPLRFTGKNGSFEMFYVPAGTGDSQEIHIQEHASCQISGNNVDGFVVTLRRQP